MSSHTAASSDKKWQNDYQFKLQLLRNLLNVHFNLSAELPKTSTMLDNHYFSGSSESVYVLHEELDITWFITTVFTVVIKT